MDPSTYQLIQRQNKNWKGKGKSYWKIFHILFSKLIQNEEEICTIYINLSLKESESRFKNIGKKTKLNCSYHLVLSYKK